jgi:uncharacterized protein (DUF433 family)
MGGRACIRGMRIPVSAIVRQLAHGASVEEVLQGYLDLEREDVQQASAYAAWLAQEEVRVSWRRAGMRFLAAREARILLTFDLDFGEITPLAHSRRGLAASLTSGRRSLTSP